MATMKAVVLYSPGPPEILKIERRPIPVPTEGQVLIRVKAFGLNRSELFTRQGLSPNVRLPRILGIEATGLVESAPGGEFQVDEVVATCMGGLGREVDGGYAEYTLVKAAYARRINNFGQEVPWDLLGALPECMQTAWGALNKTLRIKEGDTLLVRGGTTSVGLMAIAMARNQGLTVIGTTRKKAREKLLRDSGAKHVVVDDGAIEKEVKSLFQVDKVLELVGSTLVDSIRCLRKGGLVCQVGVVGGNSGQESLQSALQDVGASYEFYGGEQEDFHALPLEQLVQEVIEGKLPFRKGKTFHIDEIVEAHRTMEANTAGGKIVVLT